MRLRVGLYTSHTGAKVPHIVCLHQRSDVGEPLRRRYTPNAIREMAFVNEPCVGSAARRVGTQPNMIRWCRQAAAHIIICSQSFYLSLICLSGLLASLLVDVIGSGVDCSGSVHVKVFIRQRCFGENSMKVALLTAKEAPTSSQCTPWHIGVQCKDYILGYRVSTNTPWTFRATGVF